MLNLPFNSPEVAEATMDAISGPTQFVYASDWPRSKLTHIERTRIDRKTETDRHAGDDRADTRPRSRSPSGRGNDCRHVS